MTTPNMIDIDCYLSFKREAGDRWQATAREPGFSVQRMLDVMDANHIAQTVFSQADLAVARDAALARGHNEHTARLVSGHPGRFGAFAALPVADTDQTLKEIEYALDTLKLDGVCLPSNIEGVYLGNARFDRIWEELDRRRVVVLIRPTHPAYFDVKPAEHETMEFMFDITRAATSLVYSKSRRRYPGARVILTHGGGALPFLAWRLGYFATIFGMDRHEIEPYENVLDDIRSFHFALTTAATPHTLPSILKLVGAERLMMGFDVPKVQTDTYKAPQQYIQNDAGLTDAQKLMIQSGTARKLIPRLATLS